MADNEELNVINHLLDIEKGAASLINEAMEEADKRIAEARAKYNAEYKEKYDAVLEELKAKYDSDVAEVVQAHKKEIEDFKSSVEGKNQDYSAFSGLLDKLLARA